MTDAPNGPEGVVHRRSSRSVEDTVAALTEAIGVAGAKLFAVVDHSGEAASVGLELRDTKLIIFGNPVGGTPVMVAAPTAALDLPLKILVWADDQARTWMSYLSPEWLGRRHGIREDLLGLLAAVDALTARI